MHIFLNTDVYGTAEKSRRKLILMIVFDFGYLGKS